MKLYEVIPMLDLDKKAMIKIRSFYDESSIRDSYLEKESHYMRFTR